MKNKKRILWECAVGPCAKVEEMTNTNKKKTIIISNTSTGKSVCFLPEEFEALKKAIKQGKL